MSGAPPSRARFNSWLGFVAMSIGMFMAVLDIQIVGSSLPEIRTALDIDLDRLSWVQTAYLMAEIVAIPLTGWLTRMMSTRWAFLTCVWGFTLASCCCAASSGFWTLIPARTVQGLCGGALIPLVFSVVFVMFKGRERVRATIVAGLLAMIGAGVFLLPYASADRIVKGCTIVSHPKIQHHASCGGANLSFGNFSGANLSYADLTHAIRLREETAYVRLSDILRDADLLELVDDFLISACCSSESFVLGVLLGFNGGHRSSLESRLPLLRTGLPTLSGWTGNAMTNRLVGADGLGALKACLRETGSIGQQT